MKVIKLESEKELRKNLKKHPDLEAETIGLCSGFFVANNLTVVDYCARYNSIRKSCSGKSRNSNDFLFCYHQNKMCENFEWRGK
jgi:hypothetical protein